jgi:hypothetical protein
MSQTITRLVNDSAGAILPSQYNDLMRRRTGGFEAERRLLWAVLEDAIDTYFANMLCATATQRDEFEEIRSWFHSLGAEPGRLFSFRSICDLLEIDSGKLLKQLESIRRNRTRDGKMTRASAATARMRRLAA